MVVVLALLLLQAAPQRPEPRDGPAAPRGTAVIRGRVLTAEGRPLRRAQISARAVELPDGRTTSTNALGAYELRDLPAGRYTITVARSGYLAMQHGQRRFGGLGKPMQLTDGQTVEKLDYTLSRGGVISGRITDETGEAFSGVAVYPMRVQYFRGRRRLVPTAGVSRTDDTGQYRILALPPGEYVVMASIRETWVSDGKNKEVLAYQSSYFPGTASGTDAPRVKVAVGQEVSGIDFPMVVGQAARLSGTASGADGAPLAGATIRLMAEAAGPGFSETMMGATTKVAADGTWVLRDVPPGEYQLETSGTARDASEDWALMALTVTGADMEGIAVIVDPGGTVSGQVLTHDGTPLPEQLSRGRVTALSTGSDRRFHSDKSGLDDGRLSADGTFALGGISGPSLLRVSPLPRPWFVRNVEVAGRDHADIPLEVRGGHRLDGVKIVVTNRFPTLNGTVTDERGE
ncbi:MAG TPA: carboxypeptidase-like regulatory domain-containing protein, partial [Gemmatimonadaceae bacterium]|nr:carboxypeptidase-like regulatory domain-containing protein [Gemmatimonadaceae bacterium]